MKSDKFWNGYSNAKKFASVIEKYNAGKKFTSVQSSRLSITN
jgi:hypothetical protein